MTELRNWLLGVIDDLEDVGRPVPILWEVVAKIDELNAKKEARLEQSKAKDNPTHTAI